MGLWNIFRREGDPAETVLVNGEGEVLTDPKDGKPVTVAAGQTTPTGSFESPIRSEGVTPADLTALVEQHPDFVAMRSRLAQIEADRRRDQEAAIDRAAESFADRLVQSERRFLPAARNHLIEAHAQAARDDRDHPVAAGAKGRVAALEAVLAGIPAHRLTEPSLPVQEIKGSVPLDNDPGIDPRDKPLDQDGVFALMARTADGRAALRLTEVGRSFLSRNGQS